jgi:mono/diheme cytochrome c family protein
MLLLFLIVVTFAGQPTRRAADFDRGGMMYAQNCWMCHGKLAEGGGPAAEAFSTPSPALAGSIKGKAAKDKAVRIILDGSGEMPSFSQVFDKHEAKRILTWLEEPGPIKKPNKGKSKDKKAKDKKAKDKKAKDKKSESKPKKAE